MHYKIATVKKLPEVVKEKGEQERFRKGSRNLREVLAAVARGAHQGSTKFFIVSDRKVDST